MLAGKGVLERRWIKINYWRYELEREGAIRNRQRVPRRRGDAGMNGALAVERIDNRTSWVRR